MRATLEGCDTHDPCVSPVWMNRTPRVTEKNIEIVQIICRELITHLLGQLLMCSKDFSTSGQYD
jgi:hypothetical protein